MNLDFIENLREYLNKEQIKEFRQLPSLFKTNKTYKNGTIEPSEFYKILNQLNISLKEEEKQVN